MSTPVQESSAFRVEVERINNWGGFERVLYVLIGFMSLAFAVLCKQNPALKELPLPTFAVSCGLIFLIRSVSLHRQGSAIDGLNSYSELSTLPAKDDYVLMWKERRRSASRGAVAYGVAAILLLLAIGIEVWAALEQHPRFWFGAIPCGLALLAVFAWLQHLERQALPRQLEITIRLAQREISRPNRP